MFAYPHEGVRQQMTVQPERSTGEICTRSSQSEWLGQLWQELSTETRAEIERRAKANGFSLIDQLRFSFPSAVQSKSMATADEDKIRILAPTMLELIQALDDLIALMKQR